MSGPALRLVECCWRGLMVVPPVVVTGLFSWSIYAYVYALCYQAIMPIAPFGAVLLILLGTTLVGMTLWSLFATVFSSPGHPPSDKFRMTPATYNRLFPAGQDVSAEQVREQLGNDTVLVMRTHDGRPRYCERCESIKPDRAHHCSVCHKCILRMDHHCLFVANCVGYNNHKAFFLFVTYGAAYAYTVFLTVLPFAITAMADRASKINPHWLLMVLLGPMFGTAMLAFSLMHLRIVLLNRTSIELASKLRNETTRWLFDVNRGYNWRAFMGNDPWMWFVPVVGAADQASSSNGYTYTRFADDLEEGPEEERGLLV